MNHQGTVIFQGAGGEVVAVGSGPRFHEQILKAQGIPNAHGSPIVERDERGRVTAAGRNMHGLEESRELFAAHALLCKAQGAAVPDMGAMTDAEAVLYAESLSQARYAAQHGLPTPKAAKSVVGAVMAKAAGIARGGRLLAKSAAKPANAFEELRQDLDAFRRARHA